MEFWHPRPPLPRRPTEVRPEGAPGSDGKVRRFVPKRFTEAEWIERLAEAGVLEAALATAAKHGMTVGAMMGRKRTPRIARARKEFWEFLRFEVGMSLPEIGKLVDRNHSTVLDATRDGPPARAKITDPCERIGISDE